jgi:anti-sigma B factor antagonist
VARIDMNSGIYPGYVLVALRGELDMNDAMRATRALSAAAAHGSRIIVDLAGLTFIDCSGLDVLISARKQAVQAGGDLLLAAPQQKVLRFLSRTLLIDWLPVFASVHEAASGDGKPPAPAWLGP